MLDIIHTFEYQKKSRLPGRRLGLFKLFTVRPDLVKRISYLAGITVVLAIIRFSAMNFEFPTFNWEENPIANHPIFLVRVSVMQSPIPCYQNNLKYNNYLCWICFPP